MAFDNFSRAELVQGREDATLLGEGQLALALDDEINSRRMDTGEFFTVLGELGPALSAGTSRLGVASRTDEAILDSVFNDKPFQSDVEFQNQVQSVRNKLYDMGYSSNVKIGDTDYDVNYLVDAAAGFAPSAAITGLGLSGMMFGPAGVAVTGTAAGTLAYRLTTQGLVQEIAQLAKEKGYSREETENILNEAMTDIRQAGVAEFGTELAGNILVGKFLRGPAQKWLGINAGDAFVTSLTKRLAAGTFAVGVGEVGSEVVNDVIQKAQAADIEKRYNLGLANAQDYSIQSLADSIHDVGPIALFQGVTIGGGIGTIESVYKSQKVQEMKDKLLGDKLSMPHEQGVVSQALDSMTAAVFKKSVSVMDKYSKVSTTFAKLRNMMEHFEQGEGQPGQVKEADWHERKLSTAGDLFAPINQASSRLGRISKHETAQLNAHLDGSSPIKLNKNQTRAVAEALAGNYSPLNTLPKNEKRAAELTHLAEQTKGSLIEGEKRLADNGVNVGYTRIGGVVPLLFDHRAIRKDRVRFENDLVSKGYANDLVHAREITDNIVDNQGVPFLNEPKKQTTGTINKPFNPQDINPSFIEKNAFQSLPRFLMRVSDRVAHSSLFGPNGEVLQQMLDEGSKEVRAAGYTVNPRDLDKVKDISKAMLGKYNPIRQSGVQSLNRMLAGFETISTLGGATLSSIQEPFIIIGQLGLTNFMKSVGPSLAAAGKGMARGIFKGIPKSDVTRVAEWAGVALDQAHMEMLTAATTTEHIPLADKFFRSPFGLFLHQWTRSIRIMATDAALNRLNDLQNMKETGRRNQLLLDMGMDPTVFKELIDRANAAGYTLKEIFQTQAGVQTKADPVKVDSILRTEINGIELGNYLKPAVIRFVNQSVVAPRATNRPLWMSDPHFALIAQLKSFPIVFGNTVVKGLINKINPAKNQHLSPCDVGNVLTTVAALTGVAMVSTFLKDQIRGKGIESEGRVKPILNSELGRAIQQTGLTGALQFGLDAFNYGPAGLGGPTMTDMNKLWKQFSGLANDDISFPEFMEYVGERTGKALGFVDKSMKIGDKLGEQLKLMSY